MHVFDNILYMADPHTNTNVPIDECHPTLRQQNLQQQLLEYFYNEDADFLHDEAVAEGVCVDTLMKLVERAQDARDSPFAHGTE